MEFHVDEFGFISTPINLSPGHLTIGIIGVCGLRICGMYESDQITIDPASLRKLADIAESAMRKPYPAQDAE